MNDQSVLNTDREIWNNRDDHGYGDSIHVTAEGNIGINCGGTVRVRSVREWHAAEQQLAEAKAEIADLVNRIGVARRALCGESLDAEDAK